MFFFYLYYPSYSKLFSVLIGGGGRIVQRVSRAWRSFIQASSKTYTYLDLSATERSIDISTFEAYLSRSRGNVREVVLFRFGYFSSLSALVHICPQLSILRIYHSQLTNGPAVFLKEVRILSNLTVLATGPEFWVDEFRGILKGCASLRTLECRAVIPSEPIGAFTANLRRQKIWDESVDPCCLLF